MAATCSTNAVRTVRPHYFTVSVWQKRAGLKMVLDERILWPCTYTCIRALVPTTGVLKCAQVCALSHETMHLVSIQVSSQRSWHPLYLYSLRNYYFEVDHVYVCGFSSSA